MSYFKIIMVNAKPKTPFFIFKTKVSIAKIAFNLKGIFFLFIGAAHIFCPLPRVHTAVITGIYLAVCADSCINRVAAELKRIQRISYQLALHRNAVLLPFALQIALPFTLQVRIERAAC